MFCWGLVMTLMGLVHTTKGLYIARFFLGIAEVNWSSRRKVEIMLMI